MKGTNKYIAHNPDSNGIVAWSKAENSIWEQLITSQINLVKEVACQPYIDGLNYLNLPMDRVPQLAEVNEKLYKKTGWQTVAVPALIDFPTFFKMLANKEFPVATFIRRKKEIEYLQEPDIFHEIFGHCPMLTNSVFAEFTHHYGQLGYEADNQHRAYLARLYWFTVEFGMIRHNEKLSIYGGGILSSPGETHYAVSSAIPKHTAFDLISVLRTGYRIDVMQPLYYTLESIENLYDIMEMDINGAISRAMELGVIPVNLSNQNNSVEVEP